MLPHGVETYWDVNAGEQDGLGGRVIRSGFAADTPIFNGDQRKAANDSMIADTALYLEGKYSKSVANGYISIMEKLAAGEELVGNEKKLYDRFIVRIGTRSRVGGQDDTEAQRFTRTRQAKAVAASPMEEYSQQIARQVLDDDLAAEADAQSDFDLAETGDEDEDSQAGGGRESAAKRQKS